MKHTKCLTECRPCFNAMKQLKELGCPIIAMSATLTDKQICVLKQEYLRIDKCVVLTNGVNRGNLQISLQRYRRQRCQAPDRDEDDDDDEFVITDLQVRSSDTVSSSICFRYFSKILDTAPAVGLASGSPSQHSLIMLDTH